ncbi:MAG TPA: aminotransferase class III-fold pyridoxal phosphate-dependent enzyme [Syntrophomonadaceae bacterium]|nr:aminotransferase class III-fold pyridoxal phosphate-dependent enzyme [Syntrophomonadaceae bacterium]HQA06573.1 aminotransferase class III-fold pyridoxal phosphate-dependent enzyme [Syntrophomonadaceae bacterium]HQE22447.1 aminotransferase class III-fold pyridoxal phosphate-dependent enzyme [Syntrophomonadaceae bacterium]
MTTLRKDLLNPTLAKLLQTFYLDKDYVSGQGSYLIDREGKRYLDFIAQYGAVPFGYNPEVIWQALDRVRTQQIPSLVQPSLPGEALRLANKLAQITPGDLCYCTFCQSGTEAVEAAIKLARSATGRMTIVSTERSFHGKTLGALSATGREVYQTPFGAPVPGFMRIPFNDAKALAEVLGKNSDIAAFIVEPVQGEGGIVPARPGYLREVQSLCRQHGVVFILDEIQTGLGRTGKMFACEHEGIEPDVLLLAKALGGGLIPLGVCISSPRVYNDDFGSLHSSTFANNNLSCVVGSAVLDELLKDDQKLIREVAAKGEYLLERCLRLGESYPDIIKEVRGQGLMVGIEFYDLDDCGSFDMAYLCDRSGFTALIAGYLLNVYHIRLAPFLNNPMTLRLEPTLTITIEEIDRVMEALEVVCRILSCRDYALLYRFLIGDCSRPENIVDYRSSSRKIKASSLEEGEKPAHKFAFIIHYPGPEDVIANNPSFVRFTRNELNQLLDWQCQTAEAGMVCHMPVIRSRSGDTAEGWLIGVPYGARQIMSLPREEVVQVIGEAVDMGRDLGAGIVGLGALTSVVTRGGRSVTDRNVAITSGNSFTVLMAMEALYRGAEKLHIDIAQAQGAVVGATGSIGRACALLLSEQVANIILVGNAQHPTSSRNRLRSLHNDLFSYAKDRLARGVESGLAGWLKNVLQRLSQCRDLQSEQLLKDYHEGKFSPDWVQKCAEYLNLEIPVATSLSLDESLPLCDLIVAASNAPDYLIYSRHLRPGCVVCDVARPADVSPEVYEQRNDVLVLEGGLVQYPDNISFGPNFGYREGVSLACLSETVLLALEGNYQHFSIGTKLPLETVAYLRSLGEKHGFSLAGLVMNGREVTDQDIEQIYNRSRQFKPAQNL